MRFTSRIVGPSVHVIITCIIVTTLVGLLAIRLDSLWIDEANSAIKAIQPNISLFIEMMKTEKCSDMQMPAYMALLWCWEKAVGRSEYALRSLNIVFFIAASGVVALKLRGPAKVKFIFFGLCCSSAFVWAYLSEARPYMMQFFGATCAAVAWSNLFYFPRPRETSEEWMLAFGGLFVLFASSLLTVFFVGSLSLAFLWLFLSRPEIRFSWRAPLPLLYFSILFLSAICLSYYYLWSFSLGAKASAVGRTNLSSLLFSFYEMAGAQGLGPSRQSLRDNPFTALAKFWPQLGFYFCTFAFWLWIIMKASKENCPGNSKSSSLLPWALFVASAGLICTGVIAPFRITGRHWMPIFPIALLWASRCTCLAWQSRPGAVAAICTTLMILSLTSCLTLRFDPRHAKDDYRGAIQYVQEHRHGGDVIWWAADRAAANYYGLKGYLPASNLDHAGLIALPLPHWVVVSKPDVYDRLSGIRDLLTAKGVDAAKTFQSFQIYRLDPIYQP